MHKIDLIECFEYQKAEFKCRDILNDVIKFHSLLLNLTFLKRNMFDAFNAFDFSETSGIFLLNKENQSQHKLRIIDDV